MNKGFKILSIESKDIYSASCLLNNNGEGYRIRDKEGNILLRKFENMLDWSLDTIKLQEEYEKASRRKDFFFNVGRKKFTTVVINVKFSYSYKEFNKAGKNTYVRNGYDFRDCVFTDGVCLQDGLLIGIQTNVEVKNPIDLSLLPKYFTYIEGCYHQIGAIPVLMNKAELRSELYKNGFVCDGVKYVRYKRSAGSSRVGKCLFVNEIVAKRMARWDRCGLTVRENSPIDLASYEAYIALPMSSIIDTMEIKPENILIVDDFESTFSDEVVAVEEKDNRLVACKKTVDVTNSIWDGESLLDASMFGDYSSKGMLLLRNRFFKTCAFNTNIQQWFADNNITSVQQLNGFTLATDINQIKLITTPSSVKYLKFGTMEEWLKNIDHTFGIVKYEKETHFFGGRMVQCHYQLLNSLELSYQEVEELLKPSLDYIGAVRRDPAVLRYHVGFSFKGVEDDEMLEPITTKNEIVFKLLGLNDKFCRTKIYKEFRDSIVKGFFRNLKKGHILINGNYSTLLGNGLELLKHSIGQFNGESEIGVGNIYSKRFEFGKKILGSRSPHVCAGNILLVKNVNNESIGQYFNMTNEIVYINSINENTLQRLSGADMDSDTMLLTDNEFLIKAAEKNYAVYSVPTNCVKAQKTKRHYSSFDKADLDVKTSINKIGEIVNLSQQLNSLYWERISSGSSKDENDELYNDICKLDVLSGVEIDKAKKEFTIDSGKEIDILKRKYRLEDDGKTVKPMFFKMITTENGYELSGDTVYRYFDTPMDYLQKIITSVNYRQARLTNKDIIPFMDIVKKPEGNIRSGYYNIIRDKIVEMVRFYKTQISQAYLAYDEKDKNGKMLARELAAELKQQCVFAIEKMSSHEYLMYLVLKEMDKKENRDIKNLMFETMFGKPDETFMKMIVNSREPVYKLAEDENGTEKYYDFYYKRVASYEENL